MILKLHSRNVPLHQPKVPVKLVLSSLSERNTRNLFLIYLDLYFRAELTASSHKYYNNDVSVSAGRIRRFEVINQIAPKRASSRTEHRNYHDGPAFHNVYCMRTFYKKHRYIKIENKSIFFWDINVVPFFLALCVRGILIWGLICLWYITFLFF